MKDRLPGPCARVDDDTVIGQAVLRSYFGYEVEHPLRLAGRELRDLVEARDVPLGQHEQVRLRLRVEVADGDEAVRLGNVIALAVEPAEEAVVIRQRGSPPPKRRRPARA